jgi:DNA-binding MarR family transcriptional regulator
LNSDVISEYRRSPAPHEEAQAPPKPAARRAAGAEANVSAALLGPGDHGAPVETAGAPASVSAAVLDAVLVASRALVAVAARSLASLGEDVTLPQFRALVVLATRGPQRLAELAQALGVDPSTATRMCDRLVRKSLVHRRRTNDDRRGVRISLAPAGRELVEQVTARRRAEIAAVLSRLDESECRDVLLALRSFARAAGEPTESEWALGWATSAAPGGAVDA